MFQKQDSRAEAQRRGENQ